MYNPKTKFKIWKAALQNFLQFINEKQITRTVTGEWRSQCGPTSWPGKNPLTWKWWYQ